MPHNTYSVTTTSPDETFDLGKKIGERLAGAEVFGLVAELGGGKTALTQGIASGLGIKKRVLSPTFVLERIYTKPGARKPSLYHYDLYRIGSDDIEGAGLTEAIGYAPVVIEWAEKVRKKLPEDTIWVEIETVSDNKRKFTFKYNDNQKYLFN